MGRQVVSFWIVSVFVCCTYASFEKEMFETINRIGEDARKANTANLRNTIEQTLSAASSVKQRFCVYPQISASYRKLHTSLNIALGDLRTELRNNNPVLMTIPQEKVKNLVELVVEEVTTAFDKSLAQIRECVS